MAERKFQQGFTYIGVLFIVSLIGLGLTGAALVLRVELQREKERDLIFIGQQYMGAIASYYNASPDGLKQYPQKLEDLLQDHRFVILKRHLRKPWIDPITQKLTWGLVYSEQGGIKGIYSLSTVKPIKQAGFGELEDRLSRRTRYDQWKFIANPDMLQKVPVEETTTQYAIDYSN